MRYSAIARLIGLLIISIGLSMSGAFFWSLYYDETVWKDLLITISISIILGGLLFFLGNKVRYFYLTRREALATVGLGWFVAGLIGALPFYLSGHIPHFYDAFFETISGFTTTGASILTNIEIMPKGLLFWRSFTHWLGGMGIIVLFVALFPFLGVSGKKMYQFEVPGPDVGGIKPKIQNSAFILWGIYVGISILEIIVLWFADMPLFDSMCHTFGTMATGGFSTKNNSISFYQSPAIHLIITFFMISAGANFSLYYFFLKKKFSHVLKDSEFRHYLIIIFVSTLVFFVVLMFYSKSADLFKSWQDTIVSSFFNVVSIMTTTGYCTSDTDLWPIFLKVWLFMLMFIGGCGGSTGGGIKVVRFIILFRAIYHLIINSYSPRRKLVVKLSKKQIDKSVVEKILGFFFLYLLLYGIGIIVISFFGYDWAVTFSSVAACLNNIGPGFSLVGATGNYAFMHPLAKIFLSIYMVAGRLELFAVVIFFTPHFWRK